jgi:hypothetical protein
MEHVVFYPSADGTPAFRRVPSLEDAVNFVEHLRNSEGVTEFSVHALAEVPLSFRAYYHVEVPGAGEVASPVAAHAPVAAVVEPAPVVSPEPVVSEAPAPVAEMPVDEPPVVDAPAAEPVAAAPVEAPVAEAPVVEELAAPAEEPVAGEAPVPTLPQQVNTPFATAPPVAGQTLAEMESAEVDGPPAEAGEHLGDSAEIVPVPSGRRSMGFFARS